MPAMPAASGAARGAMTKNDPVPKHATARGEMAKNDPVPKRTQTHHPGRGG